MVDHLWKKRKPEVGDRFWTKPSRVSKRKVVMGESPFRWGQSEIRLLYGDLADLLSEEDQSAIEEGHVPFKIDYHPIYVEAKSIDSGRIVAEILDPKTWPEGENEEQRSVQWNERKQRIEWTGTPQSKDESAKKRKKVFREDDVRGSLNELLGGNQ